AHRHDDDRRGGERRRVERRAEVLADHGGGRVAVESVYRRLVRHEGVRRLDVECAVGRAGGVEIRRIGQLPGGGLGQGGGGARRWRRRRSSRVGGAGGGVGRSDGVVVGRASAQGQRNRENPGRREVSHIPRTPKLSDRLGAAPFRAARAAAVFFVSPRA